MILNKAIVRQNDHDLWFNSIHLRIILLLIGLCMSYVSYMKGEKDKFIRNDLRTMHNRETEGLVVVRIRRQSP